MHAPPHTPPSRGPRLWTAGGRELRLKSRPPAHLVSLSNNQRLRTLQRTETQKQLSHRVTPLLAQRIPLSGNSYFWRTASDFFYVWLRRSLRTVYTVCERRKRATEALAYNGLVQSWPEIVRLTQQVAQSMGPEQEALL